MPEPLIWKKRIRTIRDFNYSDIMQAGVLRERLLHSSYSLTESRIILEISRRTSLTATDLSRELGLDPGYLSRLLGRLETGGVIERPRSKRDGRRRVLKLTPGGKRIAGLLNRRVDDDIAEYLAGLTECDQSRLMDALQVINEINDSRGNRIADSLYFLREAESSDAERIARGYEALFEQTFGSADEFRQALTDTTALLFEITGSRPAHCWIAEMNGESAGSIVLEQLDPDRIHIKLLMVEPKRRGLGIGGSLLDQAMRFARGTPSKQILIWTIRDQRRLQGMLSKRGFKQTDRPTVSYYGMSFEVESWTLDLRE